MIFSSTRASELETSNNARTQRLPCGSFSISCVRRRKNLGRPSSVKTYPSSSFLCDDESPVARRTRTRSKMKFAVDDTSHPEMIDSTPTDAYLGPISRRCMYNCTAPCAPRAVQDFNSSPSRLQEIWLTMRRSRFSTYLGTSTCTQLHAHAWRSKPVSLHEYRIKSSVDMQSRLQVLFDSYLSITDHFTAVRSREINKQNHVIPLSKAIVLRCKSFRPPRATNEVKVGRSEIGSMLEGQWNWSTHQIGWNRHMTNRLIEKKEYHRILSL